ncbi:MAG: radical SAM protein [Algisphaera sp.]
MNHSLPQPARPHASSPRDTLLINEIFFSLQGESTHAGLPCVFVRLRGCHLRCHYCDTEYAFHEGEKWTFSKILDRIQTLTQGKHCNLVEITGGEPLLQPRVHPLMTALCDADHTVLIETSGACDISKCDPRVIRIMDLKTPGSGEHEKNLWSNLAHLTPQDEIKFVLTSREDYDWMKHVLNEHALQEKVHAVLVSAVHHVPPGQEIAGTQGLTITDLAHWILEDGLDVRLQTQLHKLIWDPAARGV